MNTQNVFKTYFIAVFCLGLAVSCAPKSRSHKAPSSGTPAQQPVEGSSSGGGGFVGENSTKILKMSAKGLAEFIRNSSAIIYRNLPRGWSQEKLASVIENIRYEPLKERTREGDNLMFDYGTDANGPYIVALQPFFVAYSSFPIQFADYSAKGGLYNDVRIKLAHEVSHLMGLNEDLAKVFSQRLMDALYTDAMACSVDDVAEWIDQKKSKIPGTPIKNALFVINRPTGYTMRLVYSQDRLAKVDELQNYGATCLRNTEAGAIEFNMHKEQPTLAVNQSGRGCYRSDLAGHYAPYPAELRPSSGNRLHYQFFTAPDTTELMEIENPELAKDSQTQGLFTYFAKGKTDPRRFAAKCKFLAVPMKFPVMGDKVENKNAVKLNVAPTESFERGRREQMLLDKLAPSVERLLSPTLGADLVRFISHERRDYRVAPPLEQCPSQRVVPSANWNTASFYQLTTASVFELKDGRICAVSLLLSYTYAVNDQVALKKINYAPGGVSAPGDTRDLSHSIECFKGDQPTSSEDIRSKFSPPWKAEDSSVGDMCSWPENQRSKP